MQNLELSIIQDDCTSCGLCPEIQPRHFFLAPDGMAYVKDAEPDTPDEIKYRGFEGKIIVASEFVDSVVEAAQSCPVECIYLEVVDAPVASMST